MGRLQGPGFERQGRVAVCERAGLRRFQFFQGQSAHLLRPLDLQTGRDGAARCGAVATLIIHRTDLASYPWEVVRNSWGNEKSYLQLDGTPKLQAASWISTDTAKRLVRMAGLDLDQLFQQSQSRDFKPIPLDVRLKAHIV